MIDIHVIFSLEAILVSLGIGLGGGILAIIIRAAAYDAGASDAALRGLESFLLGTLGAFGAHTFIYLMMAAGHHSGLAVTLTSLFFFIWPGVVNVISQLAVHHPVITENGVLIIALAVGGGIGAMDGLWAIHNWKGLGWIAFPLDITWGLGCSTHGLLMHVINIYWGDHADGDAENRHDAHRYKSGFRLKGDYAFTQGAVMSNLKKAPGEDLYNHERLHVWQNRLLGPAYWFSYFGWIVVWFLPALVVGLIAGKTGETITWWTYYNNTWEVMAYGIADDTDRTNAPHSTPTIKADGTPGIDWLCWAWPFAIVMNALIGGGLIALFCWLFFKGYIAKPSP